MLHHCGINAWTENSRIVHATAPTATGTYTRREQVFGVFSHEPAATRAPSGEFVIYFTTTTLEEGLTEPGMASATLAELSHPTNSYFVSMKPDVLAAVPRHPPADLALQKFAKASNESNS